MNLPIDCSLIIIDSKRKIIKIINRIRKLKEMGKNKKIIAFFENSIMIKKMRMKNS